ncbi:protein phosphatase-1 regulatory subunit 7 alpha2, partial [Plasmodium yoelii yoelii]
SYLYNERIKKECLNTNQKINCSDLNFVYNLITLIRYIIIYNYDKDFLQIFDVLSFLIFYRTLPFSLNIENDQNVENINDNMEKNTITEMRHSYLFISTETLKVFRILLSCNLYKESVEYFHDIINKIHKINIKNDIICKKFLTQVYLYISTYNLTCVDMDLSGLLYISKIIKTLEIQINNVDNYSINKEEKSYEYIHTDNSFSYPNMKEQNKLDFNYLNDLILINQCFNYIYTLFICIRKKCINIEQCIHTEQIYKLMKFIQRIGNTLIRNLSWLLDWYRDDVKRNNDKNEDNIIRNIFNKTKECPFIFSYIIYEQNLDPHFFFVIFIQLLNGILNIILEINYMNEEMQNNDHKIGDNKIGDNKIGDNKIGDNKIGDNKIGDNKIGDNKIGDNNICDDNICDEINSLIDLFSHLNQDVLKLFKIDIFKVENILDSNNVFLPLSYLFYNLYKLFNINIYKEKNVSNMNTNQNKLKNIKACDTILRNENINLIFYSLVFCSSVSLSYYSLKEITKQPNVSINNNINRHTYNYSDQFLSKNNSEMNIKREMGNEEEIKESTLPIYPEDTIPTSFKNIGIDQREIYSNYENEDEYIKDMNVVYVILFLQKYIKKSLSIYNSKKNIFLLLLKNMFRECNKPLNDINKKEEIIINKVLILFLNKNVLNFLVKHMDVSTFFKFFIQIFLVNNHKQIGDYMSEHINIYNYFVSIAELYIFNNISCDVDNLTSGTTFFDEELEYKKSIENIVFSFLQNEIKRKKAMEQNEDILNNFEKNKQNIKSCIQLKRLNISSALSQTVFEKIIESFKLGYFFNPLLLSILFFFSTVSFPQECRNIFFNDYDILKILGKNIFIHFFDNNHYIIYTISTYYGLKQHNYIIDLTKFFPSIFSFIYNSYDNFILHQNLEEYFKNLLSEYSDPSFLHFLFFMATYNVLGEITTFDENETIISHQYSRIRKIENIEKCKKLMTLQLISNCIEKIENLENNVELEHLELYENSIKKIENISMLINLKVLDLSFNKIKVIENLDALVNLEELYLSSNKISKIENLENCKNLRLLELGYNKIRKIENIENLKNLEELWLGKNKIEQLELPELPKLKKLSLQHNRLTKWDEKSINNVLSLNELYLSYNKLNEINDKIKELKYLKVLDLAYNEIENILICSELKHLEELWLNNNNIKSLDMIIKLKNNENLKTLYLEKNEIQDNLKDTYRDQIISILPQIQQLDALLVSPTNLVKKK